MPYLTYLLDKIRRLGIVYKITMIVIPRRLLLWYHINIIISIPVGGEGLPMNRSNCYINNSEKTLVKVNQELQNAVLLASKEKIWTDTYILH